MRTLDFYRSFLTFRLDLDQQPAVTLSQQAPYRVNNARVMLECCCELTDRRNGSRTLYVLGASCKSERVGVAENVWTQPNADMCVVASTDDYMILKSWSRNDIGVLRYPASLGVQPERQIGDVRDAWAAFRIDPCWVEGQVLETTEQILAATFDQRPLVARIEYDEGDYRVRLDHPVKTINVNERDGIFQTDTGPVILPDLTPQRFGSVERTVGIFDRAYAAFNSRDWAEFIVEARTPLERGLSVNHYSRERRIHGTRNYLMQLQECAESTTGATMNGRKEESS